ncbi:MAG: S8 family serine peptidase [Rhodothermales bacterium]
MLKDGRTGRFGMCLTWMIAVLFMMPALLNQSAFGYDADAGYDDDDKKKGRFLSNEYITPGWVVVKFNPGNNASAGASKTGIQAVDAIAERFSVHAVEKMFPFLDNMVASKKSSLKGLDSFQQVFKIAFEPSMDPVAFSLMLSKLPEVEYAEPLYRDKNTQVKTSPDWFEPAVSIMATPNDSRYAEQVYFNLLSLEQAWDVVKGESGDVVVAVADGGTFWMHQDMQATLWNNPGEIADNGVDDDGNGFVDDINGWNFANNTNDPQGLTNTPGNATHGTQVGGLIGAHTNNGTGIAGASWNATYMPINISCPTMDNFNCSALEAYMYAGVNGADIINASFGSEFRSNIGQDLIDFMYENGVAVIAASGNNGSNNDIQPYYPANYNHVLSVGATFQTNDAVASFSNFGVSTDIFAPGITILSTAPSNAYSTNSGTSFSSPIVAGIAALVKTQNPTWGPDQVREQLRATADDISANNNTFRFRNKIGKGRVNAFRAVTEATPSVRVVGSDIRDASGSRRIGPGEVATISVDVTNFLEPVTDLNITLETEASEINLLQPSATISSLNPGDTTTVEFQIQPAFDVEANFNANILTRISSGDYTDIDAFSVDVNSTFHNTGNIQVTLTDQGNLGYEEFAGSSPGDGFRYLGFDFLFEGGLITGNGVTAISDNIRSTDGDVNDDFVQVDGTDFGIIDGRETTEEGALQLVDSAADFPLEVKIRQDSFADEAEENKDFVILKYTIENTGASAISNYYAGLFFDWDSFDDPGSDHARYDETRKMGYFLNNTPEMADVFLATKMLTDNGVTYRSIDNTTEIYDGNPQDPTDTNDGFTNQEKWDFLSGGIQVASLDVTDISVMLSGGPFDIAAGESIEVAFALVGGTNQSEIEEHADAAQLLWDNTLSGLSPNPVANEDNGLQPAFEFGLSEPFPNPVSQEATIDFELPASSTVQLSVFDILGREVRSIVDETRQAGKHSVAWDGTDNTGATLASGVYMIRLSAPTLEGLKTATKKLVLVK